MTLVLALAAGLAIGLSLGALGGGGSVLAVPVLLAMGQTPLEATTGSLVVVGVGAVTGAVAAYRGGQVLLARGIGFGLLAIGGAFLGSRLATAVPEAVLLGAFSVLMLVVAATMVRRRRQPDPAATEPILSLHPLACACPRALKIAVTATGVGLLTGFLGVGGGFLVVPALVLALGLAQATATGTSLVVIALTSASALAFRAGSGVQPDWLLVVVLTVAASVGSLLGARLAGRLDPDRARRAFAGLVVLAAVVTSVQAVQAV